MLEPGDKAPDFELAAGGGGTLSLADLAGKKVILFFYPKAGTPGCTTQACGFRDHWPEIEAGGATVVGVSPDTPDDLAAWQEEEDLPYPLLSDPDHRVAEAYGVWGKKQMFGNEYMGIIRSHFLIDEEGRIADVQHNVRPKSSIQRALAAL